MGCCDCDQRHIKTLHPLGQIRQVEDLCVRMLAPSLVRVVKLLAGPKAVGEYQRDLKWLEEPPGSGATGAAAS